MKVFLRNFFAVLAVTLIVSHTGHARLIADPIPAAPEMNPAMGSGALALLGGVIMVIRGRRKA